MPRINLAVLGKSGAGKSTLLNYLWGGEVSATGVGRPVTERAVGGQVGLYEKPPINRGGFDLVIFDSWGMEADKADEWNQIITQECEKREASDNIDDWFHAVIYCVSAKGARIEDFEINKVIKPLIEAGHAVIFALTKSGVASRSEINDVRDEIRRVCPEASAIVEVESVSQHLRGKELPTEQRGIDSLLDAVEETFVSNLQTKLRKKYLRSCFNRLDYWKHEVLVAYDREAGLFTPIAATLKKVSGRAQVYLDGMFVELEKWREDKDRQTVEFYKAFGSIMLRRQSDLGVSFLKRARRLSRSDLEWETTDYIAHAVLYVIPGVNVAYAIMGSDYHKEQLAKKLDEVVARTLHEATAGLIS